jgi:hypothetical protein
VERQQLRWLAIGAAIQRYRLYDLDRIISRTLAYGLLTVLLGGGYAGLVLALGQLLGQDSPGSGHRDPDGRRRVPAGPPPCSSRPAAVFQQAVDGASTAAATTPPRPSKP